MKRSVTIKENYEFRRLYAKGASAVLPSVVVYCRKNGRAHNRLGVTVSTNWAMPWCATAPGAGCGNCSV